MAAELRQLAAGMHPDSQRSSPSRERTPPRQHQRYGYDPAASHQSPSQYVPVSAPLAVPPSSAAAPPASWAAPSHYAPFSPPGHAAFADTLHTLDSLGVRSPISTSHLVTTPRGPAASSARRDGHHHQRHAADVAVSPDMSAPAERMPEASRSHSHGAAKGGALPFSSSSRPDVPAANRAAPLMSGTADDAPLPPPPARDFMYPPHHEALLEELVALRQQRLASASASASTSHHSQS